MLEKSHHGSFESCDGTLFFVIHSPEVATQVHIYRLSIVSLSSLYLSFYLSILESMGVCRPSRALLYLVIYTPPYPLSHSVPSFSGGVSNNRAPLGLWIITSSWLSAGVCSNGLAPLGLWIITSLWISAYHHFLTVTYLRGAEHGHFF